MTQEPSDKVGLGTPLKRVLGPRAARQLEEKLSLATIGELLRYYPRKYDRRGKLTDLSSLRVGERVTVWASVRSVKERKLGPHSKVKILTNVVIGDAKTNLTCTFFNRWNLERVLRVGTNAMFSGTVSVFNGQLQITSPQVAIVSLEDVPGLAGAGAAASAVKQLVESNLSTDVRADTANTSAKDAIDVLESFPGGIIPVYPLSEGITGALLQRCVRTALDVLDAVDDPLPDTLLAERGLVDLASALRDVHRPRNEEALDAAIARLRYDEALSIQLVLARRRAEMRSFPAEPCPRIEGGLLSAFDADLPFTLTAGQQAVGETIATDLATIHPMNRLLQGEVGSGKTVVALRAMLQVIDSGRQAVLLAPTEVLAAQHARSLRSVLGPLGNGGELGSLPGAIRITLLTGSMTAGARREALLDIASGQAGIAVGTHALLSEGVFFAGLGLIVIDEQHRFGVEQRNALRNKHPEGNPPHVLVMTATPIPRTVAMTVYGDLDTSMLSELPQGRSPISTTVVPAAGTPDLAGACLGAGARGGGGRPPGLRGVPEDRRRPRTGRQSKVEEVVDRYRPGRRPRRLRRGRPGQLRREAATAGRTRSGRVAGARAARGPAAGNPARPTAVAGEGRHDVGVRRRAGRRARRHHGDRGRCRCTQRHHDDHSGRRAIRDVPAAPTARPGRPRRGPRRLPAGHRVPGRVARAGSDWLRWRRPTTASSSPKPTWACVARATCSARRRPASRPASSSCRCCATER